MPNEQFEQNKYYELSGADYNLRFGSMSLDTTQYDTQSIIFLFNNLKCRGITFSKGPHKTTCYDDSIQFYIARNCHEYWDQYETKLAIVKIPNDARVYVENNKFKTDKIIVEKIIDFEDMSDNFWINLLTKDYRALQFIKNQTRQLCFNAIKQDYRALQYVKNQTTRICEFAIKENYLAIGLVKEQTEQLCLLAVNNNYKAIEHIKKENQSESVCQQVLLQNVFALRMIKNPTLETIKFAIKLNSHVLHMVENPTLEIYEYAVKHNNLALQFIKCQTPELRKLVIMQNYKTSRFIKNKDMLLSSDGIWKIVVRSKMTVAKICFIKK